MVRYESSLMGFLDDLFVPEPLAFPAPQPVAQGHAEQSIQQQLQQVQAHNFQQHMHQPSHNQENQQYQHFAPFPLPTATKSAAALGPQKKAEQELLENDFDEMFNDMPSAVPALVESETPSLARAASQPDMQTAPKAALQPRRQKRMRNMASDPGPRLKKRASAKESESRGRPWSKEEDDKLREVMADYEGRGTISWKKVALLVPERNEQQCRQHWTKVLHPTIKKGTWTPEEDSMLLSAVESLGTGNWVLVAKQIPQRNPKQCRERYTQSLNPNINRGPWTPYEDEIIIDGHQRLGNKWADISMLLPYRTESQVKTRFVTLRKVLDRESRIEWTPELEAELTAVAQRHDGDASRMRRSLPSQLRGVSVRTLHRHCPLVRLG